MNYKEALDFLYNRLPMYQRIGAVAFKKDLSNTLELCEVLGNPHKCFKSVHIAGTNGKGTSAHAISSILQEAGYKTGLYTSPHLKSYRERIRINGKMIGKEFVTDFVNRHEQAILNISPSFFEITVVMAFAYFADKNIDIAVIETGLGGRLDSTNVITPLVSLITTIGKDHEVLLGNTLESIAFEKAGIIKDNIPVVIGPIQKGPKEVIKKQAVIKNAPINDNYERWTISEPKRNIFNIKSDYGICYEAFEISLQGRYFTKNIPPILEVIEELKKQGFVIRNDDLKSGLKNINLNTGLKGRWQQLSQKPLTICDIGHNEDGIAEIVSQLKKLDYGKLHFVFGTVNDKPVDKILSLLLKDAHYYFCAAKVPRALPVEELYQVASTEGLKGEMYVSVNDAIKAAFQNAEVDDLIFIGGSTFVVAEIENL